MWQAQQSLLHLSLSWIERLRPNFLAANRAKNERKVASARFSHLGDWKAIAIQSDFTCMWSIFGFLRSQSERKRGASERREKEWRWLATLLDWIDGKENYVKRVRLKSWRRYREAISVPLLKEMEELHYVEKSSHRVRNQNVTHSLTWIMNIKCVQYVGNMKVCVFLYC